jgi:methylase of polypeptide subunit release factors
MTTHPSTSFSPFADLLSALTVREPQYEIFDRGYEHVRAKVAKGGQFELEGLTLNAPPGVYPPGSGSSTEFFARNRHNLHWGASGSLLELGCGSGALGLLAAREGLSVYGGDIDPVAVAAANANARANGLAATFSVSDMFSAFEGMAFDTVIFNLPFYHKGSVLPDEIALADVGGRLAKVFFDEAKAHLTAGGHVAFSWSNCSDSTLLARDDWSFEVVACDFEGFSSYWRALLIGRPRM